MPSNISAIFPPAPHFTSKDLPSLSGKVYIITGAASGIGFELAKILYSKGGTVYIAARSASRCLGAIEKIREETSQPTEAKETQGRLEAMVIDFADLATVKGAVDLFLSKETRLDVLVNNAGVMTPPAGSRAKQGHDLEMCTNCLAPYLLTVLLQPILKATAMASIASPFSVRIVWVVSLMQLSTPVGGMDFDDLGNPKIREKPLENYMQTKAGGAWLAAEFAKRLGQKGIMSVSVHPGLIKTELQRNFGRLGRLIMSLIFKPPVYGAYSELYAGFSPDLREEHNGGYVMAWGRIADLPKDISGALKSNAGGGTGAAQKFFDYCDRETVSFL